MKILLPLIFGLALASCTAGPIPPHIQKKVDAIPASELPTHYMTERDLCYSGAGERHDRCVEKVRREFLARELTREEANSTTNQKAE